MPLTIRPERETDFDSIGGLVEESFANIAESDGDERDFVARMRHHPGYIPGLALVAERAGILNGYIMLTRTAIEGTAGSIAGVPPGQDTMRMWPQAPRAGLFWPSSPCA